MPPNTVKDSHPHKTENSYINKSAYTLFFFFADTTCTTKIWIWTIIFLTQGDNDNAANIYTENGKNEHVNTVITHSSIKTWETTHYRFLGTKTP